MREVKDISLKSWSECKWKNISSDLLFTGRERVGTDDHIDGTSGDEFVCCSG